jgi:hypothetical protein
MRRPMFHSLTRVGPFVCAVAFAGLIGCVRAQDAPGKTMPVAEPAPAKVETKTEPKAVASSKAKLLFGQCPPGTRAEFAAITDEPLGLAGAWFILGQETIEQFVADRSHGLALAKELDAIPVVWLALRDGWPDGKFVDQDIVGVARALAEFKNSKGEPQMSIVRLFLEPWNRNWHGPKDAATYRQWWTRAAKLFRANGCGPERVLLSADFFPSGVKPEAVREWIPDEAQLIGLDLYQLRSLTPGTPANKIVLAVVAEAKARKLPLVVLESGVADGISEADGRAFITELFDFVQQNAVAWMFGSYDWSKVEELAAHGWKSGLLSADKALLADFKKRLAAMKLRPAPFKLGKQGG